MDEMVLRVQEWLNEKYSYHSQFNKVIENGRTGWSTVYALTRALQIELGISSLANSFGPTTESRYIAFGELSQGSVPNTESAKNIVQILQGACWCKGYGPGGFNGNFGPGTASAVQRLQTDANLPQKDGKVYAHVFKAFLTMDAYVKTIGGNEQVRQIQRELNNKYYLSSGVQPCDGYYQRQTNRALIYGIQTEIGIARSQQTGTVGPATRAGLPHLRLGATSAFVSLFKYALVFNGYNLNSLNNHFNDALRDQISSFQKFVLLPENGEINLQTWLSLLVSTGDTNRRGTASDAITQVTAARAQTLVNNGYEIIGRYLTNVPGGLNKRIQPGELNTIFNAGLSVFPIFQESHSRANNFSYNTGYADYQKAFQAAMAYGFPKGTTIYFAVDFDVLGHEITGSIIPHFKGINHAKMSMGDQYNIGVYGPRSACIEVSAQGLANNSFVSGMSTGFSGNLGYRLPRNWAFDQISTITIGTGAGSINIDNNINSGRDKGASSIDNSVTNPGPIETPPHENSPFLEEFNSIENHAKYWVDNVLPQVGGVPSKFDEVLYLTTGYYRQYSYTGINWSILVGPSPSLFISSYDNEFGKLEKDRIQNIIDPITGHKIGSQHMLAVLAGRAYAINEAARNVTGWAGDLITVVTNVLTHRDKFSGSLIEKTYQATKDLIGAIEGSPYSDLLFDIDDLLGDVDAVNIGRMIELDSSKSLSEIINDYYQGAVARRFSLFVSEIFGDEASMRTLVNTIMTGSITSNPIYYTLRTQLRDDSLTSEEERGAMARAFCDKIMEYVTLEN